MKKLLESIRRLLPGCNDSVVEVINGPHRGYFVAAYALPSVGGFIAYAKIFREKPTHPWEGHAVGKYVGTGECEKSAIGLAEFRAMNAISNLTR